MAERLKAAVLKTVVPSGTVGSNPTSSAIDLAKRQDLFEVLAFVLVDCRLAKSIHPELIYEQSE